MKHIINKRDYTKEVDSLTNFAKKRMGFSNTPKILFDDDIPNSHKTLGKTGYYNPANSEIHIYASGRHIKDILRSLAHEFVHHMQNEKGDLTHDGYMGQGYAQKNPKMREMERQAYEMGNLCFRDWEDSLKQKHPTIYNERRNRKMSLKDWKNKELNENLNKKWGFGMDLSKLNEGYGAGPMDPMGGQSSMEMAPPMDDREVAIESCVQQKVSQGMSACDARPQCEQEMAMAAPEGQPPMQMNPEMPFQENNKQYNLEENQDRIFAPNHYCAHHVVHEGKEGFTVDHNWNKRLKKVTRYDVKFLDGSIKRNIHESKLLVLEAFTEESHKRDDHPPAKRDKDENKNMPKDRIRRDIEGDGQTLPKGEDGEIDWKKADEMAADIRQAKPDTRLAKEAKQFAGDDDLDGDGDGKPKWADDDDPANKGKKSEEEKEDKSEEDKKEPAKKGKMPPGLAKYHAEKKGKMKESLSRKIRVKIKR